ncbi:hypothetical protein [Nesterenkonia sp. F]|uniref:hypothetical protein n=1 Tax=Nesterenkonia sp. F TaxID=795955 RepID=UPI0013033C71|nr:hypothetical protein [Nesterenkonia sp. F]
MLALVLTGCGADVPNGPMDEDELESTYLTGRGVPEDWSLADDPSGRDRYGDPIDDAGPGDSFSGDPDEQCQGALDELESEIQDVEYVAEADATYTKEQASVNVTAYSTQQEVGISEPFLAILDDCETEFLDSMSASAPDDLSRESLDTEADGVAFVSDEGSGTLLAFATVSYGKNHLGIWAGSEDSRDMDAVVELVDAVQERFEEGPDAGEED